MATDQLYRVEATGHFLRALEAVKGPLTWPEAASHYTELLADLSNAVLTHLARFPLIGKRYLDHPPQSAEALAKLAQLPPGRADALRVYLHGEYVILYVADAVKLTAYLLTICHQADLSFDFARLWPGTAA
jgi:hypothetical protein